MLDGAPPSRAADLDGNGQNDFVMADCGWGWDDGFNVVRWWHNFTEATRYAGGEARYAGAISRVDSADPAHGVDCCCQDWVFAADLDGDGDVDVLTTSIEDDEIDDDEDDEGEDEDENDDECDVIPDQTV